MDGINKEVLIPKTPAQLSTQINWVNLRQIRQNQALFVSPPGAVENALALKQEIGRLRQSPDGIENTPYARYEDYLRVIRELRKEQRDKQDQFVNPNFRHKEEYLESSGFVPHIATEILLELDRVPTWSNDKRVFTDQELQRGIHSEQEFLEVLNTALDRQPKALYKGLGYLTQILPAERIKNLIGKVEAEGGFINYGFISNFTRLKSFFTPEEQRAHIDAELRMDHNAYFVLYLFQNPEVAKLYSPAEAHSIIVQAFKDGHAGIHPKEVDFYMENGVLSSEDVQGIAIYHVNKLGDISRLPEILPKLAGDQSRAEVKAAIFNAYSSQANAENSRWIVFLKDMFTSEELFQMINEISLRDRSGALHYVDDYEKMASPEKFVPILREILGTPDLQLDGQAVKEVVRSAGLTLDEKEQFIDNLIATNRADLILYNEGEALWGLQTSYVKKRTLEGREISERRKELSTKGRAIARKVLLSCDTHRLAETYGTSWGSGWKRYVDEGVVVDVIDNSKYSEVGEWIYRFKQLDKSLREGNLFFMSPFIEKFKDTNAIPLLMMFPSVVEYQPEERKMSFALKLISANPAVAIAVATQEGQNVFSQAKVSTTQEQIMQLAQSDEENLSFAPRSLREFFKRYHVEASTFDQKALLIETSNIYQSIGFIKSLGLEAGFRKIQSQKDLSAASEKELLSTFYCFALFKDRNPQEFAKLPTLGNSLEEARMILFNQLAHLLGIEKQLSQEEVNRFMGVMETPVPFMTYLLQHEKSPIHKKLLREIFESIVQGKFSEWKYGQATKESLIHLKEANLLPANLSLDQYTVWRTDGQASFVDSLATDTETTASSIANYLEGNLHHLHIEKVMEDLMHKSPDQDPFLTIQGEIATLGQKLATTNKELSDLKKSKGAKEQITMLEEEKLKLEGQRKELLRARRIIRLITVKPNEVALGYFFEGKDGKQRGELISQVLSDLQAGAPEEDRFVYGEVQNMLNALKSYVDEKQNLLCTDSSNPKVWLEIGEKPVASCQSYANGGHNDCLVAYTDPNTKILVLRNEKGNIIARSIFRLLTTGDGTPALHIERIYSSSTSKAVARTIYARAYQKAQEMKVPLLISEQSQDEGGTEKDFEIAEGYQGNKVSYSLFSKSSRAPKVYVDSAGGVVRGGDYEMANLLEIKQAAA